MGKKLLLLIAMLDQQKTLNCRGRLLVLDQPKVMGILNITDDSFYAGSRLPNVEGAIERAGNMLAGGATILDVGGMSSRPGAPLSEAVEEADRVVPVIEALAGAFPEALISVDTVHALVARQAIAAGAHLINDISAGRFDPDLYSTVAKLGVPYILMHMKGKPENMMQQAVYESLLTEVWDFLAAEIGKLRALGVRDIVVDPGFGFGKTVAHNFELLRQLHAFRTFDLPVLAGVSRKSMIWRTLGTSPEKALNGTTALHMVALQQGASILRVHDVVEAVEVVRLWQELYPNGADPTH